MYNSAILSSRAQASLSHHRLNNRPPARRVTQVASPTCLSAYLAVTAPTPSLFWSFSRAPERDPIWPQAVGPARPSAHTDPRRRPAQLSSRVATYTVATLRETRLNERPPSTTTSHPPSPNKPPPSKGTAAEKKRRDHPRHFSSSLSFLLPFPPPDAHARVFRPSLLAPSKHTRTNGFPSRRPFTSHHRPHGAAANRQPQTERPR